MNERFPRTMIGGVELPRMIVGTNWMLGYSHTSSAADALIKARNSDAESVARILNVFLTAGIDAVMAPFAGNDGLLDGVRLAEEQAGRRITLIDTPIINVDDNASARREAESTIAESARIGARFCLPHHTSVEQLVNKNVEQIPRLPDYLSMIRAHGMIPGLSAHMPELIIYSDQNGYDVETYIQLYNAAGFLLQVEADWVQRIIRDAKKPVMTIKPLAAGRLLPVVGLSFVWNTIRDCDMVTIGTTTPAEAREVAELSLDLLGKRIPENELQRTRSKTSLG